MSGERVGWALLTSNEVRHRYVANVLSASPAIRAVVAEPKKRNPADRYDNEIDRALLQTYFERRSRSEETLLAAGAQWDLRAGQALIEVASGALNDPAIPRRLRGLGVERCLVFGTSWLREPWLEAFGGKMVNLHLGLSPYFRGAGTNFWALYQGQPELFGATVQEIDAGIDSGPILFHVRPDAARDDDAHSFGNKTIAKAARALLEALPTLPDLEPLVQWDIPGAREYKMKDFDAASLRVMLARLDAGLLREYADTGGVCARAIRLVREFEPVFRNR
jgi:hypothetical protein